MSLISMAIYDTNSNGRESYTGLCLRSISNTVNWERHRIFLCVNSSTEVTRQEIYDFEKYVGSACCTYFLTENLGTAKAVNFGIRERHPNECVVKMDNDVVIHQSGWLELMEAAINSDPKIGILGLKRKDVCQRPDHPQEFYRTYLINLNAGIIIERTADIIGTCTMFNPALLDKVGYLYQPGLYGFDDVLMCVRSLKAGFFNAFLPEIHIDHIDPGGNEYTAWKRREAGFSSPEYHRLKAGYESGEIPLFHNADGTQ